MVAAMSTPPPPPPPGGPSYPPQQPQQPYGGAPPGYAPYGQPPAPAGMSGMAVAGFVCSLVALIPCFWFWFLQIPGYVGTVLSFVGLKQTANGAKRGRGLAVAGLIIGIITVLIALGFTAFVYTSDDCIVDGLSFECNID
jgi:hypothetical protein